MNLFENNGAEFSACRKYRYALWRIWDASKPYVMFIGLNPSKANEIEADNTIKRVRRIAEYNGYGGFYMMNCFPYVSTNPNELITCEPNSYEWNKNDLYLLDIAERCQDVVFAWGNFKVVKKLLRDKELLKMFPDAKTLHINDNGSPKHPLFCRADTTLIPFNKL